MARTGEARRARMAASEPTIAADLAEVVIDPPDRRLRETAPPSRSAVARSSSASWVAATPTTTSCVSVPDADVVFAGDLVEGGAVPFFNDGYPLDWPATARGWRRSSAGTSSPATATTPGAAFADEQAAAFAAVAEPWPGGSTRRARARGRAGR